MQFPPLHQRLPRRQPHHHGWGPAANCGPLGRCVPWPERARLLASSRGAARPPCPIAPGLGRGWASPPVGRGPGGAVSASMAVAAASSWGPGRSPKTQGPWGSDAGCPDGHGGEHSRDSPAAPRLLSCRLGKRRKRASACPTPLCPVTPQVAPSTGRLGARGAGGPACLPLGPCPRSAPWTAPPGCWRGPVSTLPVGGTHISLQPADPPPCPEAVPTPSSEVRMT